MPLAHAFSDLWSAAAELHTWLVALFGRPAAFLARRELTRAERQETLRYLRPLEQLLRRLIVHLALTLEGPLPGPPHTPPRRAGAARPPRWPGAESAHWPGVRFTTLPPPSPPRPAAPRLPPPTTHYAWPIARRMEALARVLASPERAAWRLAAKLRTRTTSWDRAWRLAARAPDAPDSFAAELNETARTRLADALSAAHDDSG